MQSTPFLLWICTHYTACTPLLQSLFRHFVLRALNVSKSQPFQAIGMGRRLSSEKRIRYIRIRSWMYFFGGHGAPARSLLRDILWLFFRIGHLRRKRQFQKLVRRENHFH